MGHARSATDRDDKVRDIAERLDHAWRARAPIQPISEHDGIADVSIAYAIQTAWASLRLARGERIIGRKIGLTSEAVRAQLGVSEPDYGALWASSYYPAPDGVATIPATEFLQPRVEGEIAFRIARPLREPGVTPEQVIEASDACALAVEIVDSRVADWRIKLVDTIADNASYGGFTHGPWDIAMPRTDLSRLMMRIHQDGALMAEGVGAAVLGHPARATAWLANRLIALGVSLEPGDIVISGAFTKMLPAAAGDEFVFSLTGQPDLTVRFVR